MHIRTVLLGITVAGLLLGQSAVARAEDAVGGGSSFPSALYAKWIDMLKAETGLAIAFNAKDGSAAGQSRMLAQEIDFTVAGMPMSREQRADYGVLQFPVVIGAVVCIHNIPGIASGQLRLNAELLAKIFSGAIRKWNDPAIGAVNPGVALPDMDIRPISLRDGGMDATYGLTQYILAANPDWREKHGAMVTKRWAVGSTVMNSVDMLEVIKVIPGSIGYTAYGLAAKNNIPMVALRNPAGQYIVPSLPGIAAAAGRADWANAEDLVMTLVNQPGPDSYPIAQTSYAQVLLTPRHPERSAAAQKFFDFAYSKGGGETAQFGFVPLPAAVQEKVRAAWSRIGS